MPCNKREEITWFSHAVVRIFCPVVYYLVLGVWYVAFKKVLKLKQQLQMVSQLLLQ